MNLEKQVFIFKTNIVYDKDIKHIAPSLNNIEDVMSWNFDLNDCDNILRIEAANSISATVIAALTANGFTCQELF